MAYISSKSAQNTSDVTANSSTWETVCETDAIAVVLNNRMRIKAGWHASGLILGGDVRVVLHDGTTDNQMDDVYPVPLGTVDRTICKEALGAVSPSASHKAKLQIRAGAASSVTVDAYDGWIELLYITT